MSATAIIGALLVGKQTAKGTAQATAAAAIPATAININATQQVQATPLEIGGGFLAKSSYKTSVSASGDASILLRPDSLGHLLLMLTGSDTVTPVPSQSGAFSHVFTPYTPGAGALPWYTITKDAGKVWYEQYTDVRMSSFRVDVQKQSIVSATAGFFGLGASELASAPTEPAFDSTPIFQTCQATVSLATAGSHAAISANSNFAERISLSFENRLTQDEFAVGSYTAIDTTLTARTINIGYDLVIRDTALRRAIYQNGSATTWSPQVYRGELTLVFDTGVNIPTTTTTYKLTIAFPGIDFLMMPISMNGPEVMRASLSAQVTLGASGTDQFTATLVNGVASY